MTVTLSELMQGVGAVDCGKVNRKLRSQKRLRSLADRVADGWRLSDGGLTGSPFVQVLEPVMVEGHGRTVAEFIEASQKHVTEYNLKDNSNKTVINCGELLETEMAFILISPDAAMKFLIPKYACAHVDMQAKKNYEIGDLRLVDSEIMIAGFCQNVDR